MFSLLPTRFLADLRFCLGFWSRLPVGADVAPTTFSRAIRALPLASLVLAAPAGATLALSFAVRLPVLAAATLAILVLTLAAGALHEDGLADCADGMGGWTPERRLEIMKDSRLGSYGALALVFSVLLRAAALAALLNFGLLTALTAFFAAAAVSRTMGLAPLFLLTPARKNGLGFSVGAPDWKSLRAALFIACCIGFAPCFGGVSLAQTTLAVFSSALAACGAAGWARAKLGGHTGDVAGAAQNCAEIVYLLVLSAG